MFNAAWDNALYDASYTSHPYGRIAPRGSSLVPSPATYLAPASTIFPSVPFTLICQQRAALHAQLSIQSGQFWTCILSQRIYPHERGFYCTVFFKDKATSYLIISTALPNP